MANLNLNRLRFIRSRSGNVIETYKHWVNGRDDPSQVSITYSAQFYEVCASWVKVGIISSSDQRGFLCDGQFTLGTVRCRLVDQRKHNVRSGMAALDYFCIALEVDVAVVCEGTTHWFVPVYITYFWGESNCRQCIRSSKYAPKKKR